MNIIELAKEAGFIDHGKYEGLECMPAELERFAALVRAEALEEAAYRPYTVKLPTFMVGRNWHSEEIQRWLDELPPLYVGPARGLK